MSHKLLILLQYLLSSDVFILFRRGKERSKALLFYSMGKFVISGSISSLVVIPNWNFIPPLLFLLLVAKTCPGCGGRRRDMAVNE